MIAFDYVSTRTRVILETTPRLEYYAGTRLAGETNPDVLADLVECHRDWAEEVRAAPLRGSRTDAERQREAAEYDTRADLAAFELARVLAVE